MAACPHDHMITGSVLDILIYVFDRYMLTEVAEVPEREHLVRDLERAGFAQVNVERALDWLADLACDRDRPPLPVSVSEAGKGPAGGGFSGCEPGRFSAAGRGVLGKLERRGLLSPPQRG